MALLKFVLLSLLSISRVLSQGNPGVPQDVPPKVHEIVILEPIPIENIHGRTELRLECSASGYPAPKIQWSFNGVIFEKDKPFGSNPDNTEGVAPDATIRHTLKGNRLTIKDVKGKTNGDPKLYDSGRYRCIASNTVGAVFLEKNIQIRVMGYFFPGNRESDDVKNWNPTVGRSYTIRCPRHVTGYGTEYKWGVVDAKNKVPEYWRPGDPNPRVFQTLAGELVYSVVKSDDLKESRNVGGLRCILINFGITRSSNQQQLWQEYETVTETRKPVLIAKPALVMNAPVNTEFSMVCGATGSPVPKITWEYQGIPVESRYPGSEELNFEFFQILGGGLELRLRRVTQYSGGTFKCYAQNDLGLVWESGQLLVQFPPRWVDPFPETIEVPFGNRLEMSCNATGTPEPKYEWFQNATKIVKKDDRKIVTDGLLQIASANFEDNGIYVCVGFNVLDTITQSIFIKVQEMAPSFAEKPLDDPIYLFRTATMLINCDPKGGPIPEKTWKKTSPGGQVINIVDGGRYKVMANGSLQITDVQLDDAGEYECTATNKLGTDKSAGTAVILEPTIITNPPQPRQYAVGWQYARLFCGASWDPRLDLRIEWYKGGVKMAKFSDKVYLEDRATGPPRILYIKDLTIEDAGDYSCHAYTKVGHVISEQTASALLTIKAAPEPPAGVQVSPSYGCQVYDAMLSWSRGEEIGVETRRFFIEFSTNKSMSENKWYGGEGDPLIPNSRIEAFPGTRVTFKLDKRHLMPGNNLIFRIRAMSDHLVGRASRASTLGECETPQAKPPINPYGIQGIADGPDKLTIRWRSLPDVYHGGPNYRYILRYRQVSEPPATWTEKIITDLNKTEERLENAGKNVQYEYYIRSQNDLGDGPEIKAPYPSNFSGRDPPTDVPGGFEVERITRFTVDLRWIKTRDADSYRVKYWNITDAEDLRGRSGRSKRAATDKVVYRYMEFNGDLYEDGGSLTNLTAQVMYLAQVQACNTGGCGPESDVVEFFSQARVPGVPTDVNLQVYGDSALINWSPPIEPNGYIEVYEIFWYKSGADQSGQTNSGEVQRVVKDRRTREAYLIGVFDPMVYYNIFLAARNRVGPGQDWSQILFSVSAPDLPGKPGAPQAKPFDDSAINITFERPSFGGLPSKFYVYYRRKGSYYQTPMRVEQAFPKRAWTLVTGLEFQIYDFWTVGVNSMGQSETSDVTVQRPVRRPKPQAHASEFEWWRSNWFIAIMMCILFILITTIVVVMLLKSGPRTYKRLKEEGYSNGSYSNKAQPMQQYSTKPSSKSSAPFAAGAGAAAVGYDQNGYDDRRNPSASEPPSEADVPPPRYPSQSSIEKKEDYSGSESGSQTGSDYSGSETGSDYSDEDDDRSDDRSYYSDEEKRGESGSDYDDDATDPGDNDMASFV